MFCVIDILQTLYFSSLLNDKGLAMVPPQKERIAIPDRVIFSQWQFFLFYVFNFFFFLNDNDNDSACAQWWG